MNGQQIKCAECGKFIRRPYDSLTPFGCANPEAPEPYDEEFFCKPCSVKRYKTLAVKYKCCYREGDWQKSDAEIRAAKEAGLVWIGNSETLVEKSTGRHIMFQYIREGDRSWGYVPYLEYEENRRKENKCKCFRKKNEDGDCSTCLRAEVFCLCKYDSNWF